MFYLEDEKTDLKVGDPLETDVFLYNMMADEKKDAKVEDPDPAIEDEAPAEEITEAKEEASSEEVSAEETVEVKEEKASTEGESPAEAITEEKEEASSEEVSAEETVEVKEEEAPSEGEAPDEEDSKVEDSDSEPAKPEMDPEEVAYVAQQTALIQATYYDIRKDLPAFRSGDTVSVGYKVIEGERSRIQSFDGVVIKISSGHGIDKTFTVRKVSSGIGVERIFPLHSPNIDSIKVLKEGKVRRAKLYYLRNRVGKATRIKERVSK